MPGRSAARGSEGYRRDTIGFMESGTTSVTLDQPTAMQLRAVKQEMSEAAGHVVPLPMVIRELVACWRREQAKERGGTT
jgi:hypothetical protein